MHHPLENVFRNIDFNSEAALGRTRQRNERLRELLNDFADERLDLRPSRVSNMDIIGNTHEYLIGRFAAGAGKKAGEFYTPPEVSILLANLSSVIASLDSGVSVHAEDLNLFICQVFAQPIFLDATRLLWYTWVAWGNLSGRKIAHMKDIDQEE